MKASLYFLRAHFAFKFYINIMGPQHRHFKPLYSLVKIEHQISIAFRNALEDKLQDLVLQHLTLQWT